MKGFLNAVVSGTVFCLAVTCSHAAEVSWTGCGVTKKAFMSELAAAYESKTATLVKLSGGGATKGIRAASAGTADMGGSCRVRLKDVNGEIHPEERDAELVQVAWDAMVVVVNPINPVSDISMENLKKVYDGEISNWNEIGGVDRPIGIVARAGKTNGVGYMYRHLVFGDADYTIKARALEVKNTGPLEKKVEKIQTAIAIDGISSAKKRNLKFLSLDGVAPTKENIASGRYPLFRPLYITINKNNPSAEAKKFIQFALSPEGQAIISEQGTVNLSEGRNLTDMWQKKIAGVGL